MSFPAFRAAVLAAGLLAFPALAPFALADGVEVHDPYARSASATATTGAAFMVIHNHGTTDDRLVDVTSPVAARVELHTHRENAQGVMQMIHVAEGFDLPAGGEIVMDRGGHHVMLMGLKQPLVPGETIPLTLVFEQAGALQVDVPVDIDRQPDHGGMTHGSQGHGAHGHGKPGG